MKMDTLLLSAIIGVAAGIIDVIPMIIQKLDKRATISAFLQYFFVSIIIVNIDLPHVVWWLQGGLISVALAFPVVLHCFNARQESRTDYSDNGCHFGNIDWYSGALFDIKRGKTPACNGRSHK